MRMVYADSGIDIELVENCVNTITIEAPSMFRSMVGDLWEQTNGGEGKWIISEAEKELKLSKICEVIVNPFAIDVNDRKMVGVLCEEIKTIADSEQYEYTSRIQTEIYSYLESLISSLPYSLSCDLELDLIALLKSYHIRLDEFSGIERIINYMKLRHQVIGTRVFVWVNGKNYFSEDELEEIYKEAFYEKIQIVVLEAVETKRSVFEESLIFDKDFCII